MKNLFVILVLTAGLMVRADIVRTTDGNYVLENRFFQAVVAPLSGGRIISFKSKITGKQYTSPVSDLGIGGFADWQDRSIKRSQWFGTSYRAEVISGKPTSKLVLDRIGNGGIMQWLSAGMTYELSEDSSSLRISYRAEVNPNAMKGIPFCFWLHNAVQTKGEKAEMALAAPEGVRKIGLDLTAPLNESFHYDAVDGWFAFKGRTGDEGLVFSVPYENLMCFYNWQAPDGNTMEMMFHSHMVPNGQKFELPVELTLFNLEKTPDGAGNGMVGSFSKGKGGISGVCFYSAVSRSVQVDVFRRVLPGLLEIPVATGKVNCTAGKNVLFKFAVNKPSAALEELICRVRDTSDKLLMTMRSPLGEGEKSAGYVRQPEGRKKGDRTERFGKRIAASLALKDCYQWNFQLPLAGESKPWIKPYAGGKIRLLILTDMIAGREVIELAGRMDAEVETCTYSGMGWLDWHSLWGGGSGFTETSIFLGNLLKKDWDAILISGIQIDKIAPEHRKRIMELVRCGTGLVSIMPTSIPASEAALFPAVPMIGKPVYQRKEPLLKPAGKFASSAAFPGVFPFEALRPVILFPYQSRTAVVTADGRPFCCMGKFGRGKTALFTWLVGRPDNTQRGGIMPFQATAPAFAMQDYYYGMVIKTLLWSACREPTVAIRSFQCSEKQAVLVVNNTAGTNVAAEFELATRSVSNGTIHPAGKFIRNLAAGSNRVILPLDQAKLLHGMNLIDARLKINKLSADFAAAALEIKRDASIVKADIPEKVYLEGETIPVLIQCTGDIRETELAVSLVDRHGRVLAARQSKLRKTDGTVRIDLVPQGIYTRTAEIRLELLRSGKMLDFRKKMVDLLPKSMQSREWNDYRVIMGWPVRANRVMPFHLRPLWEDALNEFGINTMIGFGIPVWWGHDDEENRLICRAGFMFVAESIARLSKRARLPYYRREIFDYRWRSAEFKKLLSRYNETRDKKYLQRNPTLEDEQYIADYTNALRRYLPTLAHLHPVLYDLGDEMSYGLFSNPADFDFSESSLRHFRKWLSSQYVSISELNAEWKRSFRNFDEVVPDTALEARERKIYAAWGMHRIYAAKVFTDFLRLTADTIRAADPGAKITLSGTQEPKPFNGYDWPKMMPLFDSVTAYTINGMAEVMGSFRKIPAVGWSGYGASRERVFQQIWNNAFYGHFGVALYNEMVLLNPDLTLTQHAEDLRSAFMPLKNGIGSLLYHSNRKKPVIAFHYSQPSAVAAWIEEATGDFSNSRQNWINLIKSLGFNLKFVNTTEIENGILLRDRFKGLVLPSSFAMSPKERAAIGAFARSGGVVLADIEPGPWTDRFVRTSPAKFPGMMVTGRLPEDSSSPAWAGIRKKIKKLLDEHGAAVKRPFLQPAYKAEVHQFELSGNGGELIAFLNYEGGTVSADLPKGKFLYDVLRGSLIRKKSFSTIAGTPGVYVVLPYQVEGIQADISRSGREVSMNLKIQANAPLTRHVFLVEVFRAGKKFAPYSAVIEAPAGSAVHRFCTGIGENQKLSFIVTDVISGKQTKGEI